MRREKELLGERARKLLEKELRIGPLGWSWNPRERTPLRRVPGPWQRRKGEEAKLVEGDPRAHLTWSLAGAGDSVRNVR